MVTNRLPMFAKRALPGALVRMAVFAHLAICRQGAATVENHTPAPRFSARGTRSVRRRVKVGEGAVGRVLCLPNRAPRPNALIGLLRSAVFGWMSDGAGELRAIARSGGSWVGDAGASLAQGLIGVLHAAHRASPTVTGVFAPLKPCMNGLPAHAPVIPICRSGPHGLHARPACRGDEELH